MATAILYKNTSDDRLVDKSISKLHEVTVSYKDDTNMITPTIKLANFSGAFSANYVYLSDFGRYYFVTEITASQQHIYMTLECDELYTYRAQLRTCDAIVKRQQNLFDLYLDDEKFNAEAYGRIQTKRFSGGFTKNAFVLAVAGGR